MSHDEIELRARGCLTVKQLIEKLQKCPEDALVVANYPSGDFWHSRLALSIDSVKQEPIVWSEYHKTFKVPAVEPEAGEKYIDVVILS